MEWIMTIPSFVFSKIKNGFSEDIKTEYNMGDANFSTSAVLNTTANFPFVYIKPTGGNEEGMDLTGDSINAARFTFQIEVSDNRSQARARKVMSEVISIMKQMKFELSGLPLTESTEDIHTITTRFERVIGGGDTI